MADTMASGGMQVGGTLEYSGAYTSWFALPTECCCSKDVEIGLYAQSFIFGICNKCHI